MVDSFLYQILNVDADAEKDREISQNQSRDIHKHKQVNGDGAFEKSGKIKDETVDVENGKFDIWEPPHNDDEMGPYSEFTEPELALPLEQVGNYMHSQDMDEESDDDDDNDNAYYHRTTGRKNKFHQQRTPGRPKGSKMKPMMSSVGVGRFRRLGYYPDYCVSETVYKEAIANGTPYVCPLCKKEYKERRSLGKCECDSIVVQSM